MERNGTFIIIEFDINIICKKKKKKLIMLLKLTNHLQLVKKKDSNL